MKIFRKCFYCNQYTLEPDVLDYMQVVIGEAVKESIETGKKPNPNVNWGKIIFTWLNDQIKQNCSFCGYSLSPTGYLGGSRDDKGNEKDTEAFRQDMIERIYDMYDEFVKFMDGTPLPKREDVIMNLREGKMDIGGMSDYDEKLNKFIITVHMSEIFYYPHFKQVLFHEFTHLLHIYDPITGKKKKDMDKSKFFTEVGAKHIEMLAMLGFNTVSEKRKIRLTQKVHYYNKLITFKDFLYKAVEGLSEKIIKRCDKENTFDDLMDMFEITRNMMYFRGIMNFCTNYLSEDSIGEIPDKNYMEKLLIEKFKDDADLLIRLFDILDRELDKPLNDINGDLVDEIISTTLKILMLYSPQYKNDNSTKDMVRMMVPHWTTICENWDKLNKGDKYKNEYK